MPSLGMESDEESSESYSPKFNRKRSNSSSKYTRSSENGRIRSNHITDSDRKFISTSDIPIRTRRRSIGAVDHESTIRAKTRVNKPLQYKRHRESVSKYAVRSFNYNDPDLSFQMSPAGPVVMGGTKEKLISLLSDISVIETRYIREFLGVYPYFATCSEVLQTLHCVYHQPKVPEGLSTKDHQAFAKKIQRRVLFVLTRWLQNYPRQFYDAGCIKELQELLESIDDGPEKTVIVELFQTRALSYGETFDFLTPRIVTEETKSPLFLRKPTVLAQQLCILDQKQFFQIEVHELKDQSWNSGDNSFGVAPNTTRCIEYFNRVSYWCATEIVSQKSLKMRVKVLKRILVIAQKCMEYKNYNTLFAIISSLSFSSISRLKMTWRALPSKYEDMYKEMKELCCVEKHYLPYKKLISTQTPPLVPYLGVFLRDLTFIEVGNSNHLDEDKKMINYDKYRMLAVVLADLRKYQQIPYDFEVQHDVQTSLRISMLTLDEDQLFNLSRIVEPPTIARSKRNSTFITRLKRSLEGE